MAASWMSGSSAGPGASVNLEQKEEKPLCPGLWETGRDGGGGLRLL